MAPFFIGTILIKITISAFSTISSQPLQTLLLFYNTQYARRMGASLTWVHHKTH